jgi:hypothetical protein
MVEGELDEPAAARVDSHIFACSECRKEYETLRREKEIYARYLFNFEPSPGSWINFQARLAAEKKKIAGDAAAAANASRRRKRTFVFSFSPVLAALLFICAIGFVWLKSTQVEMNGDKYVAETESRNSPPPVEINPKTATDSTAKTVPGDNNHAPKNNQPVVGHISLKTGNNNLAVGGKSFSSGTGKIKPKTISSSERKKSAGEIPENKEESRLALRRQNLEKEIAGQIEKVELLLRSFRNAGTSGSPEIFDVDYERRQARRLLEKNAALRRDAESNGISYAEELLSRIEPYLLDIANLENEPAPGKVLNIKQRVSNLNIIASLQVYGRVAAQ